jgi:hypothetical protein
MEDIAGKVGDSHACRPVPAKPLAEEDDVINAMGLTRWFDFTDTQPHMQS